MYAEILDQYILDAIAFGAELNDAGLPVNAPPRRLFTGPDGRVAIGSFGARSAPQAGAGSGSGTAAKAAPSSDATRQAPAGDGEGRVAAAVGGIPDPRGQRGRSGVRGGVRVAW